MKRKELLALILLLVFPCLSALPAGGDFETLLAGGIKLFDEGRYAEAAAALTRAIELNPGSADAYARRAACNMELGKLEKAYQDLRKALLKDPQNAYARKKMAELSDKLLSGEGKTGEPEKGPTKAPPVSTPVTESKSGGRQRPSGNRFQNAKLVQRVSQAVHPSSEPQTVSYLDRVHVTVPGGLLESPQTLTISDIENPPSSSTGAFRLLRSYDISLGERSTFREPLTLEFGYDPASLPAGTGPSAALSICRWDPEAGAWTFVPFEVDTSRNVVRVRTTHLSAYGQQLVDRGWEAIEDDRIFRHFRIIYNQAIDNWDATRRPSLQRPEDAAPARAGRPAMFNPTPIRVYAETAARFAEAAYDRYARAGFYNLPGETEWHTYGNGGRLDIIIGDIGEEAEGENNWRLEAIFLRCDLSLAALRLTAAHELFHQVQREWGLGTTAMLLPRLNWFTDTEAEYAAGRIANERDSDAGRLMGQNIEAGFLHVSLDNADNAGIHMNHQYRASHFLAYLFNADGPFYGDPKFGSGTEKCMNLWRAMRDNRSAGNAAAVRSALGSLSLWASPDFEDAYANFASYYMFNTNSPLPANPRNKVPGEASSAAPSLLRITEQEATSPVIDVPARFSTGVWRVIVQAGAGPRNLVVESVAAIPNNMRVDVFALCGGERQNLGRWGRLQPVCTLDSKTTCSVALEPQAQLYILAMNFGDTARQVTVRVREEVPKGYWRLVGSESEVRPDYASYYLNVRHRVVEPLITGTCEFDGSQMGGPPPNETTETNARWMPPAPQRATAGGTWNIQMNFESEIAGPSSHCGKTAMANIWGNDASDNQRTAGKGTRVNVDLGIASQSKPVPYIFPTAEETANLKQRAGGRNPSIVVHVYVSLIVSGQGSGAEVQYKYEWVD